MIDLDSLQKKAKERTVRTQTIEYDLETIVKKIDRNIIKLNPEYQRNHRWSDSYSAKLIESLILNIPIPIIYISQDFDVDDDLDHEARYSVIDGQQRLTAIYRFFRNEYRLCNLEVLDELNGYSYSELPPFLTRRLEERMIRCLRIDSTVDTQVKYDIFERLNSGSVKLEAQELRNAVCRGDFRNLIKKLAKQSSFVNIANLRIINDVIPARVKKMEDEELVVRFFAVCYEEGYKDYRGKFKDFLTDKMKRFNDYNHSQLKLMEDTFIKVMGDIERTFPENPFAKYKYVEENEQFEKKSNFNAAVYDAVCFAFLNRNTDIFDFENYLLLFKDQHFFECIEGSVNDVSKLTHRIALANQHINS